MCWYLAAHTRVAPLWSRGAGWYVPEKAVNLLPQLTTEEKEQIHWTLRKLLWKPSTPYLPHNPQPWKFATKLWLTASAHIYHNWRSVQVDVHAWAPHEQDNTKKITSKTQCCVCVDTRGLRHMRCFNVCSAKETGTASLGGTYSLRSPPEFIHIPARSKIFIFLMYLLNMSDCAYYLTYVGVPFNAAKHIPSTQRRLGISN